MGFVISDEFKLIVSKMPKALTKAATVDLSNNFSRELEKGLREVVQRDTTLPYSREYEESFNVTTAGIGSGSTMIGRTLNFTVMNDSEHAEYIGNGTEPGKYPGFVPQDLYTWAMNKVGLDSRAAYVVARYIYMRGLPSSANSPISELPPSGESGYNPILHMEELGRLQDILTYTAIESFDSISFGNMRIGYR